MTMTLDQDLATVLDRHLRSRTAKVAVLGLGYVGLPLAVAFARAGFAVRAIDVDANKIETLRTGRSYIADVRHEEVAEILDHEALYAVSSNSQAQTSRRLTPSTDYRDLAGSDAILISVPTPMTRMKQPDISYIVAAAEGILPHLRPGMLIVLQSTTYPGTTENEVRPILERGGLRAGSDFYLAFVPERINPGDARFTVSNTPTIAGGVGPQSGALAAQLFSAIGAPVTVVSSASAAELTKCYENTFRFVNIALANEMAKLCERMGLNAWEITEAAKTKPFGFLAHYPSAGVGGHCILVDPYYLACAAREYDLSLGFIQLAADVNEEMPYHVAGIVRRALGRQGIAIRGARILILGVAFKRDIDDARNSPSERIIESLLQDGAKIQYHDPYVTHFPVHSDFAPRHPFRLSSVPLTNELLDQIDCAVVVQAHTPLDYRLIASRAPLVVDACNAMADMEGEHIVRLGVGDSLGHRGQSVL